MRVAVVLLLLTGCSPKEAHLPVSGSSQVRAGESYIEHDACQGEGGCAFGPMVALRPLVVYATEAVSDAVAFGIEEGEVFETLGSNLHFDPVGGVVVSEPTPLVVDYPADTIGWANPGDTVPVLSYVGEGYYTIWFDGATRVVRAFWDDRRQYPRPRGRPGRLVIEPEVRTWLQVGNADGRVGWLLAEPGRDFVAPGEAGAHCVRPTTDDPIEVPVEELAGEYRLAVIGSSGEGRGKRVDGELVLRPRPRELQPVLALDMTPMPNVSEPLYGTTTADLDVVGAYTEGSLTSADPAQPGIAIRVDRHGTEQKITLHLGSERNRRGQWILDGAFIDARVLAADMEGFSGVWEASLGPTTYHAGGYFCALRKH